MEGQERPGPAQHQGLRVEGPKTEHWPEEEAGPWRPSGSFLGLD